MWTVPPMWIGRTVAVLASGESMSQAVADEVRHLPRIAVNNTWKLAPDADIIHAADAAWWNANEEVLQCAAIKISVEAIPGMRPNVPDVVKVLANTGIEGFNPNRSALRTHANGGAQAVQIAAHAGAARILLLGFDMHGGHWHEPHPEVWGNPNPERFARWIDRFADLVLLLAYRGVEVVNCTPGSHLDCCRFASVAEALTEREAA